MAKKGGGGNNEAMMARIEEQQRQDRIREGTATIDNTFDSQFTDDYYGKLRQSYLDYALPQVKDQYSDARKQLQFALARNGTLDSSMAAGKTAELDKLNALQVQNVADQANNYSTQSKSNVENARSDLIKTLNATGDASQAASSAISRANVLSEPPAYSPLSQLFNTFTSTLGQQAALERASAMTGSQVGRYNTGLFGNSGSVKVT